jgi:hypothetical protein
MRTSIGTRGDHRVRRLVEGMRREAPGLAVAVLAAGVVLALSGPVAWPWPTGRDALAYWLPPLAHPYAASAFTAPSAYLYSPAFLQVLGPLRALPWQAFLAAWTVLLVLAVRFLCGARLVALGVALAAVEIAGGNIHLLLAVAVVAGFRWPAAWAFVLLTKVTPGVGLLWFAIRGEWRSLAIASGATAAIAAVSYLVAPAAWIDWIDLLLASTGRTSGTWSAVAIPLVVRLPLAVAVVAWGARTDRPWTVPVAAMLALPALWYGGLSMLLAVVALRAGGGWTPSRQGPSAGTPRDVARRAPAALGAG